MRMINIVIPIAGRGKKFEDSGSIFPKALIEINGKPMVQVVAENLRLSPEEFDIQYIFIVNKRDHEKFAIGEVIRLLSENSKIIVAEGETAGSACSVLLSAEYIDNKDSLIIANGDQYLSIDMDLFIEDALKRKLDGSIIVFDSVHPRWSFVKLNDNGYVVEAAEKRPISRNATAGVYYFSQGAFFVEAAKNMIRKEAKIMGQYFVCPAYNEMVLKGMEIGVFKIDKGAMYGLGTPEEVKEFEKAKFGEAR